MLKALAWIDRMLGEVLKPVVFAGMAALICVITLQIVSRLMFTSVSWTEEVARFLLIWITFLGGRAGLSTGGGISLSRFCVTACRHALPGSCRAPRSW